MPKARTQGQAPPLGDDGGVKPKPSPPRAPVLRLRLHGDAQVIGADGSSLPLRGRAAALVALAALEPGIRRERAAALLWPESLSARQNLRQQLLRFRQALGAALIDGDDQLRLATGVRLEAPAPGARLLADEDGFDEALELWLEQHRQSDRRALLQPLLDARDRAETSGDLDRALHSAQELVALEPLQELHHAALMRLHYLRGEPAAGLVVYQRLSDALQAGVGSHPAAATQDLASALRRMGQLPAATAGHVAARSLPVTLKRPPVMAGRGAELAAVLAAWGAGQAVLVEGEAGMGKSRLLAECLSALQGPTLRAAGRPGDGGAPYSTLVRLLQPLLATGVVTLSGAAQEALARIGVGKAGPRDSPPRALASGAMLAAVAEVLDHAGVQAVALDDLHFADDATLELMSGLAAPAAARRWLFAHRPAEAPPAAKALRHMLTECLRLSAVTLSPLDERAAAELVDALAVQGLHGDALAPALVRHSGGNPLFLLETLKQGLVDGSLARGELPRPANVGALIEQRLQRLSEPALALARVAAIAGVDFSIELAEAAIGQSAVQLASAWRELQDAQVLRDEALAHDLVADAALRGVPPVVARRVHAQCASWLAGHGGDPARVARHWLTGNRPGDAAQAFEAAARRARAASRPAEEAELYHQAALAHGASGQLQARFEALALRVSALIGAQADDAALAEARALPSLAHNDVQRVRAARVLADLVGQRGPFEESVEISLQGAALARRIGEQQELVRLTCVAAGNLLKIGRAPEGYSMLLPLREWVDQHAADDLRQIWYGYWAAALGHTGRLREGVASYDVAIACAERAGEPAVVSMALLNQSVVLRTMGALERAFEGSRRGLALSSDEADNAHHRMARLMHARNEAETGRFSAAQQALDELLPQFEAMGAPFWVHAVRMTQVRLWQHLGQHTRALQALQLDDAEMPAWLRAGRLWLKLEVQQWLGQPASPAEAGQALALLDGDPHRRTGNAVRGLRFAPPLEVLEQWAALADRAQELELFGTLAALQLHRARAALSLQRHGEAVTAAHALLVLLRDHYVPDFTYGPEAWLVAAQALRAGGDAGAARQACNSGQVWVRQQALPQVPAPFIDSFLHRNPVNRELLAFAVSPQSAD